MKINFAQVSPEELDYFGSDELFKSTDGTKYFYFTAEYGTNPGGMDEVAIHDGCNRYMPIAVDNIPDMIKALQELHSIAKEIELNDKIRDLVTSDIVASIDQNRVAYSSNSLSNLIAED